MMTSFYFFRAFCEFSAHRSSVNLLTSVPSRWCKPSQTDTVDKAKFLFHTNPISNLCFYFVFKNITRMLLRPTLGYVRKGTLRESRWAWMGYSSLRETADAFFRRGLEKQHERMQKSVLSALSALLCSIDTQLKSCRNAAGICRRKFMITTWFRA